MRISTQCNVHIICVIHQNYGSQKLGTGHLGSALEKKAETVISLELNMVQTRKLHGFERALRPVPIRCALSFRVYAVPYLIIKEI